MEKEIVRLEHAMVSIGKHFKKWKKWICWLDQASLHFACYSIVGAIGIKEIAEKTNNDPTVKDLRDVI